MDPRFDLDPHEIHLAFSDDGIRFVEEGVVLRREKLVDPDVFLYKGTWFMDVFGDGNTLIDDSKDGMEFSMRP